MVARKPFKPPPPSELTLVGPKWFRPEVYLFKDPEIKAMVIAQGPDQSEVKFSNGNIRVVCNSWMTWIK